MADITGTSGSDILTGTVDNDTISGEGGDDRIIGSKGFDSLYGINRSIRPFQPSQGTVDYSNLGRAITLLPTLGGGPSGSVSVNLNVGKGDFGVDTIAQFKQIIGATNKENIIDASNPSNTGSEGKSLRLNVNLANNSLVTETRGRNGGGTVFNVVNFVNVIGSMNDDIIVGANKKGKLTGGGGSDTITGGNKNDILTGSDSTARGVGEIDVLTGGGGRDKFVLGDANGAYYVGKGKDDYATITDFNLFQDSIDLGGFKDYSFASAGNNTIELYSGKDVKTRDLIAKIQLAGGISSVSSNSRSVMAASGIDAITSKINIFTGSSDA
jgi:Ca2+-binding RTX toxin-like protein